MRWLLNVLKSRVFLTGVGFVMLVVLVLALGAWLDWSLAVRLVGVIAVLVVALAVLAVSFVRANRAASAIEQSIKMQAQQQVQHTRPDRQGEIEELQDELERAIERLKQSKLGGRRGKAALYALPWYMFIGPPAAGKTTAIANSGLHFPIGTNAVRGVGGTRNCDWFFADQAILLDTAGRYMTEHEDTEEWIAFLETLKKHRRERPINGVIVGISMAELAEAEPDEIIWHANNIRRRIDELIKQLGISFPVYLLFTKCDLLQGFVQFFGELSRREREQVLGATFEREETETSIRQVFEREFDRLYEVLTTMRTHRLARSMKREDRRKVYVFPLEFASVKDNLTLFVDRLFQPNPYQESPIFRGFYFTSGTQEGIPIDRVIQAIAEMAQLPVAHETAQREPETESKSYFINDVFTEVVIPDQYLVAQTSGSRRKRRWLQAGVGVAATVMLGLFLVGSTQALVRSRVDLNRTRSAAAAVAPVRWESGAAMTELAKMETLHGEIAAMEEREEHPPWSRLGLYRGGALLEPARGLYVERARDFVGRYARPQLQQRLEGRGSGSRLQGEERAERYADLKAYLLMTSEVQRLEEEANRQALRERLLQVTLDGSPVLGSAEAMPRVEQQIAAFVEGLHQDRVDSFEVDPTLVNRVRSSIFQPPSVANLYATIKQEAQDQLPPFRFDEVVPNHYLSHFRSRPEVPGFFTKEGWSSYVQGAIEEESKDPERTEWVMGYDVEDLPSSMKDEEEVASQLEALYFSEYASRWQQFLGQVRLATGGNVRTIARQLEDLGNQYDSPLLYVLAQVGEQTSFRSEAVSALESSARERVEREGAKQLRQRTGMRGAMPDRGTERELHPVERRFAGLHALKASSAKSGGADPALYEALESLANVAKVVDELSGANREEAATFAASVLQGGGGELDDELRRIENALGRFDSDVRARLFEQPVLDAWGTILVAAQAHLDERWRMQIYEPYAQRLAEAFPFADAVQSAALMDVESYFQPESGQVVTFLEEELAPFVQRDGSPRTWKGRGIRISPAAQRAMEAAERIASGLFSAGALRVDFELQPELPEREGQVPAIGSITITIHGESNTYPMSSYRPWTAFSWPGRPGADISLSTQQGIIDVARYDGDWAFLRLLRDARIQRVTSSSAQVRWVHDYGSSGRIVLQYNLKPKQGFSLFDDPTGFFRYQVPETLG